MRESQMWPSLVSGWSEQISDVWKPWQATLTNHSTDSLAVRDDRHGDKLRNSHVNRSSEHRPVTRIGKTLLYIITRTLSLLWYLIPRRGQPVRRKAFHELHALAYLDALRGYLAMIIFTGHTMPTHWKWIPSSVLKVPWFHFPFRGGFTSLDIFFWISGYSITYRLIGFIQTKRTDKVLDTLASSMFRRYMRLFLPILPVTFFTVLAVTTGLAIPPDNKAGTIKGNPFWWWVKDTAHVLNPFTHILGWWDGQTGSELLDPLWSLNAEFRSSMILYAFCTANSKLSSKNRRRLIWMLLPAFMCWQAQWAVMAFLGMWFAECRQQKVRDREAQLLPTRTQKTLAEDGSATPLTSGHQSDVVKEKQQLQERKEGSSKSSALSKLMSSYTSQDDSTNSSRLRKSFLVLVFLYSFVYLYEPYKSNEKKTYPHVLLNRITPDYWHPQMKMHLHLMTGAFMMLYPLDQMPLLQRPLLTPFSQYLGELSFGIYAVHFPVRWMVWEPRYVKWVSERYGKDNFDRFWILSPGYLMMAILVLWAADLFRRLDVQVVRFCKNVEDRLFE